MAEDACKALRLDRRLIEVPHEAVADAVRVRVELDADRDEDERLVRGFLELVYGSVELDQRDPY